VPRRGGRDAKLWNATADIVINGTIAATCDRIQLAPNALRNPRLEHLSVEEIYDLLLQAPNTSSSPSEPDLLAAPPEAHTRASEDPDCGLENTNDAQQNTRSSVRQEISDTARHAPDRGDRHRPNRPDNRPAPGQSPISHHAQTNREAYWGNAIEQAKTIAKASHQGEIPAGIQRELDAIAPQQLDWRRYLWRYLTQIPADFQGFDRRFIGRGLYLDALQGETLSVAIAIDRSSSIADRLLSIFLGEIRGILATYPHIQGRLYYADAQIYGPYPLATCASSPGERATVRPIGGGGTSFIPFFERVTTRSNSDRFGRWHSAKPRVCVYLTDGYGTFPTVPPSVPVLWVVAPGGRDRREFPFGDVVSLKRDR